MMMKLVSLSKIGQNWTKLDKNWTKLDKILDFCPISEYSEQAINAIK